MSRFREFLEKQEMTPALGDLGSGVSEYLMKISRLALENHLEDTLEFFEKLAKKDPLIKEELSSYKRDPTEVKPNTPKAYHDIDTITPQGNREPDESEWS